MGSSNIPYFHASRKDKLPSTKLVRRKGEIICYTQYKNTSSPPPQSLRSCVSEYSNRSANRLMRYLKNCEAQYRVLITLTYPKEYSKDGKEIKHHLKLFMQRMRRHFGCEDWSACWILEFQKRGAPHYHILCNKFVRKEWVAEAWSEITSGNKQACSRVEQIFSKDQMWGYMASYIGKKEQKVVPENYKNVGRFWGVYGMRDVAVMSADIIESPVELARSCRIDELIVECCNDNKPRNGVFASNLGDIALGFYITVSNEAGYEELERIWRSLLDVTQFVGLTEENLDVIDRVISNA